MSDQQLPQYEKLQSGKEIHREFNDDGSLIIENHGYGMLDIMIEFTFEEGVKTEEAYFVKRRFASRRSYEKARGAYPDMPPADASLEDLGATMNKDIRQIYSQIKKEREARFAASAESKLPRPTSTNWLRVIAADKWHLLVFASRDWKVLLNESRIPMGRHWLRTFAFFGAPGSTTALGPEIGYEVTGDRNEMLKDSKLLLPQVVEFASDPTPPTYSHGWTRPRKPPRKQVLAWPSVLPPLIGFLEGLTEAEVKIYNHHR
jgi:hypothetical protein